MRNALNVFGQIERVIRDHKRIWGLFLKLNVCKKLARHWVQRPIPVPPLYHPDS